MSLTYKFNQHFYFNTLHTIKIKTQPVGKNLCIEFQSMTLNLIKINIFVAVKIETSSTFIQIRRFFFNEMLRIKMVVQIKVDGSYFTFVQQCSGRRSEGGLKVALSTEAVVALYIVAQCVFLRWSGAYIPAKKI